MSPVSPSRAVRDLDRLRSSQAVLALAMIGLLVTASSADAGMKGSPSNSGVIAIECEVRLIDETVPSTYAIAAVPWIVNVASPKKIINPSKKHALFYFAGLAPGTYRIDGAIGITTRHLIHEHHDTEGIVRFRYRLGIEARRPLTVTVSPGDVQYLGHLEIYDAIHQDYWAKSGNVPPLRMRVDWRLSDAVKAGDRLTEAGHGSVWETRFAEWRRAVSSATVRDTSYESTELSLSEE